MSLSPSDQHSTPGSLPSWPLRDFNTPLSCLLQDELQFPPSFMASKSASPSPSPSPSPSFNSPQLLSSPASIGATTAKVSKRKSRAVNKPPIRILSADRASFRDMVQQLTGIPTSPSMQAGRLWGGSNGSMGIFRPMAARPASQNDLLAAAAAAAAVAHQSMPTLDTSSAYLSRAYSSNNLAYNEGVGKSRFEVGNFDAGVMRAAATNFSRMAAEGFDPSGGRMMYDEGGAYANHEGAGMRMGMEMESLRQLRCTPELESLLMVGGNVKLEDLLPGNKMDHWGLSPEFFHTPISPQVPVAHSA